MKFLWISAAKFNAAMAEKDAMIAKLEAKTTSNGDDKTAKIKALFGDAAEAEGFDLEAAVQQVIDYKTGLEADLDTAHTEIENTQKSLDTANTRLDDAAKALGQKSAEGVDLVALINKIEPEGRTNPLDNKKKEVTSGTESFLCEYDTELAELKKKLNIG